MRIPTPGVRRTALAVAGSVTLAISALASAAPAGAQTTPTVFSKDGVSWVRACDSPANGDTVACHALKVTTVSQLVHALGIAPNAAPAGYGPADLRSAYKLPANGGAGQTIAIVDAYDDPTAESDMAVYRAQFGLPACTTANGCFKKVNQTGGTKYPAANTGWAAEISLDLDMVSAIAPKAHIILVEATSATVPNLGTGVNTAVKLGAKFVSNSYGGSESLFDSKYDASYFNHPGVAITASAGDSGYGAGYPAASRYVTAVGGTALKRDSSARGWSESVWGSATGTQGTGSGCSAFDAKPTWQKDAGCSHRTIADVSAVADPHTGVAVYQTYGGKGWAVYGGTSASSPIIASVYALAGTPSAGSYPASFPYAHRTALNDVITGSNGICAPTYLCNAGPGYDGPTGLGTPNGTSAFVG